VGREASCEIPIDNLGVSRQHCAFEKRGDAHVVVDLGSSNGTFCNGRRIKEHYLNDGDEVAIGKFLIKFHNTAQKMAGDVVSYPVPDTLDTYVMDGDKVKEQLAKLRSAQVGELATPGKGSPATAREKAMRLDAGGGAAPAAAPVAPHDANLKLLLLCSVFLNVVLLAILLYALFLRP
jgi:pSer/pThr/pTyr-binding forkhead associated (FHA) protein